MPEPCEEAIELAKEISGGFSFKRRNGTRYYDGKTTALARKIQAVIDKGKEQRNG